MVFDRLATGNARPLAVIPGPRTGDQFALYPPNGLIITARGGLIEGWSLDEGLRLYANAPRSASDYAGMNRPLRDGYGLMAPNSLKRLWEFNPGFGGPLAQDRLWFYYSARHAGAQQNVQQFFNKNAGNPDVWTYEADTSRQFANENTIRNYANVRLTWQASQKHKVGFTFDGNTGYDIRGGGPRRAPEAFMSSHVDLSPRNRFILDWTAPVTNLVLLPVHRNQILEPHRSPTRESLLSTPIRADDRGAGTVDRPPLPRDADRFVNPSEPHPRDYQYLLRDRRPWLQGRRGIRRGRSQSGAIQPGLSDGVPVQEWRAEPDHPARDTISTADAEPRSRGRTFRTDGPSIGSR